MNLWQHAFDQRPDLLCFSACMSDPRADDCIHQLYVRQHQCSLYDRGWQLRLGVGRWQTPADHIVNAPL